MSLADTNPASLSAPQRVFHFGASAPVHHQGQGNALTPENLNPPRPRPARVATPAPVRTPTTALLVATRPVTAVPAASVTPPPAVTNDAVPLEIVAAIVRMLDELTLSPTFTKNPKHVAHVAHRPHRTRRPHPARVKRLKARKQNHVTGKGHGHESAASNA
jgi:hypothetical protein